MEYTFCSLTVVRTFEHAAALLRRNYAGNVVNPALVQCRIIRLLQFDIDAEDSGIGLHRKKRVKERLRSVIHHLHVFAPHMRRRRPRVYRHLGAVRRNLDPFLDLLTRKTFEFFGTDLQRRRNQGLELQQLLIAGVVPRHPLFSLQGQCFLLFACGKH